MVDFEPGSSATEKALEAVSLDDLTAKDLPTLRFVDATSCLASHHPIKRITDRSFLFSKPSGASPN